MDSFLTIFTAFVVLLLYKIIRHLTSRRGFLEQMNIPIVPTPFPFIGSGPFGLHKIPLRDVYTERHAKYGKTFGYYEGVAPVISSTDPDVCRAVLVENFDSFGDIAEFPVSKIFVTRLQR